MLNVAKYGDNYGNIITYKSEIYNSAGQLLKIAQKNRRWSPRARMIASYPTAQRPKRSLSHRLKKHIASESATVYVVANY